MIRFKILRLRRLQLELRVLKARAGGKRIEAVTMSIRPS